MNYPKLNEIPTTRDLLDKFKGYNHNLRIGEGEFYDMQNLTGDDYPILSPRKKRGTYGTVTKPNGMCSNTKFCYVDGQDFHMVGRGEQGETDDETVNLMLTNSLKELISIGSNVVVMPDQKYINTVNTAERGSLMEGVYDLPIALGGSTKKPKLVCTFLDENYNTIINNAEGVGLYLCGINRQPTGVNDPDPVTKPMPDAEKYQNWYCLNWKYTANQYGFYSARLKLYKSKKTNNTWFWSSSDGIEYVGFFGIDDDTEYFEATMDKLTPNLTIDGLGISYLDGRINHYSAPIEIIDNATSENSIKRIGFTEPISLNNASLDYYELKDWFSGYEDNTVASLYILDTPIKITTDNVKDSTMPALDYIIESENRLWGCKYGLNNNGEWVNEIYSSRLGDFKDWVEESPLTSMSPYVINVGTSGKFTGAINYGGKPIFFKEDCMHRVFGDYTPYSCVATPCKGVQEGCSKSLAIVNDVLYYKSRTGICAYDGSLPVEISSNFGDKQYTDAVGGAIGNKYYISMKDVETGEHEMFVYDTVKKLWHKEDNTQATQFCNHQGNLYYIDRADNRIHVVKGTGNGVVAETDPIKWGAETGILGATTPDDKYVTRIDLRMSVAKGSKVSLHIEYDSMGEWERLMEIEGLTLNTFTVPVIPRRCDHFRLKFEGEGDAKIFSISKTLEESE